jgi:hypothetical protein
VRGVKCVAAVALAALGAALGTLVGAGGSSSGGQATAASLSGGATSKLDPVLNQGTKAVLKAVDQGLALVLGKHGKGGSASFKTQQTGWNRVKNSYTGGESKFVNATNQASDQFLNGVLSGRDPSADLIQLLKLISGYEQKVSSAGARWDQAPNTASFDLKVASTASAPVGGAGAGKMTVANGLKGATHLIQTVVKAEVKLYEKVAVTEILYEGGILDGKTAIGQIDAAFAEFEAAITGGAKNVVKGAPVGWNIVVNKQVTPVANSWNLTVNKASTDAIDNTPQTQTTTTLTTTVTQPRTTVTITCPTPPPGQDWWTPGDPMTVTGSASPPAGGQTVTLNYAASPTGTSTTHTVTTAADGTFTDATTAPPTMAPYAQSIQATAGGETSNACPAEFAGG